jgi:hypothetical protein
MMHISKKIAAIIIVVIVLAVAIYGVLPRVEKRKELHVVINEFYPGGKQGDPRPGWVELYNPTDEKINITYWNFWYPGIFGPLNPWQFGLHYIYPHEYLLLGNKTLIRKYWNVPNNVRIVDMPPIAEPPAYFAALRIEAKDSIEELGETVDKVPMIRPPSPPGHSWARYRGEYGVDNFTANFYDEPEPTPGYENHRAKEKPAETNVLYLIVGVTVAGIIAAAAIYYLRGVKKRNDKIQR